MNGHTHEDSNERIAGDLEAQQRRIAALEAALAATSDAPRRSLRARLARRAVVIIGAFGLAFAVSAPALAAIPGLGGVIAGCYNTEKGNLRVIDAEAGVSCDSRKETAISWNQTGPQGLPGERGEQGEPGPQGEPGAPGVSGYTYVIARSEFTSAGRKVISAYCPAGKTALGGGGEIFPTLADPNRDAAPIALESSLPTFRQFHTRGPDDINGWMIVARETAAYPQNWHVSAYAICATVLP